MQRSRQRQFHDFRQPSQRSEVASMTSSVTSASYHPQLNPQNTRKEACYNCINRFMAEAKVNKKDDKKEKLKDKREKRLQQLPNVTDPMLNGRQKMAAQIHQYNQKAIQAHQQAKIHEKELDQQYAMSLELSDSQMHEDMQYGFKKDKERAKQYRQDLYQQVMEQKERRQVNKLKEKQGQPIIPVVQFSKPYDQMKYRDQLKREIDRKAELKALQKEDKIRQEKQMLRMYESEGVSKRVHNPEIFEELKELEQKKLNNTLEKRRQQEKERKKQMIEDRDQRREYIEQKMKSMESYVKQLTQQISDKKKKNQDEKREQREQDARQFNAHEEEQLAKSRQYKDCLQCHQQYPVQYIGPIPQI